jgi:hypothetical protein
LPWTNGTTFKPSRSPPFLRERRIDEAVIRTLLGWRHSGFSLHNAVRIGPHETEGRRAVSEYVLRSPFSLEKFRYHATTGTVLYHSKMHPVLKRNYEVFSACDWLAALTTHIPNAGERLVRYYGWHSNVNRGKRRRAQGEDPPSVEESSEVAPSAATRAWARLIKQVYEVDPLVCPRCAGPMRVLAFIEQPEVIDLPVPGTADREDPDSPRPVLCPELVEGARLSPQPAGRGTRCHIPCNGSPCRVIRCPSLDSGSSVIVADRGVDHAPRGSRRIFPLDSPLQCSGYFLASRGRSFTWATWRPWVDRRAPPKSKFLSPHHQPAISSLAHQPASHQQLLSASAISRSPPPPPQPPHIRRADGVCRRSLSGERGSRGYRSGSCRCRRAPA